METKVFLPQGKVYACTFIKLRGELEFMFLVLRFPIEMIYCQYIEYDFFMTRRF